MEEWPDDEGGVDEEFDWSNKREKFTSGHHVDISEDDDGIQVRGLTCWLHISSVQLYSRYHKGLCFSAKNMSPKIVTLFVFLYNSSTV